MYRWPPSHWLILTVQINWNRIFDTLCHRNVDNFLQRNWAEWNRVNEITPSELRILFDWSELETTWGKAKSSPTGNRNLPSIRSYLCIMHASRALYPSLVFIFETCWHSRAKNKTICFVFPEDIATQRLTQMRKIRLVRPFFSSTYPYTWACSSH